MKNIIYYHYIRILIENSHFWLSFLKLKLGRLSEYDFYENRNYEFLRKIIKVLIK